MFWIKESMHMVKKSVNIPCLTAMGILLIGLICGISCRHDEEAKEKIESIEFEKESAELIINEEITVRVIAKSDEGKKNERIIYSTVDEGIIEIKEPTNDGIVIRGIKDGSTVVVAKSKQVTAYFAVRVRGDGIIAHYVNVGNPVIELGENESREARVTLYGGNALDNFEFQWRLESGKNNIRLDASANIAYVTGLERGYQKVFVSHPKADFESEILVFVKGYDEPVKYITSASNVVLAPHDGQYHNFQVVLVNGAPEDVINFEYEVTEGDDVIEIVASETVCNIMAQKSGYAVVRVSHPLAVMDFNVKILVYEENVPFITVEQTFLMLQSGESRNIKAEVENSKNSAASHTLFSCEVIESRENVVDVIQNQNYFYIRANRSGNARVIVSNEQAQDMPREILVVVREDAMYRDDYYITTSQNVIIMQTGDNGVQLEMQLINGVSGDVGGFQWVVEDGTIIEVESAHGKVSGNRSVINSVFNAVAYITPKKPGVTRITLSHPKAESAASVLVKVYPKGTFDGEPLIIRLRDTTDSVQGPIVNGLIHIGGGEAPPVKTLTVDMVSGSVFDIGAVEWSTADTNLATVQSLNNAQSGMLSAVAGASGLTKIKVGGGNLSQPYECLVAVDMPGANIIFVDNNYQTIAEKQVVNIEVKDSNNEYSASNDFIVSVEKPELLYAVMVKNKLMLQGKQRGETKVVINHSSAVNEITLNVTVVPDSVNIDKPYYIGGPEIIGLVRGYQENLAVNITPPAQSEEGKLVWSVDDPAVVRVMGNGKSAIVTGLESYKQTRIRVEHSGGKAENERVILAYVVETAEDLSMVMLGVENENHLMESGERRLITLITNASEEQKKGIVWTVKKDDGSVIEGNTENSVIKIEQNYTSAMVEAKAAGHAEIIIKHEEMILPLTIYVSVVSGYSGEKLIKGPAVIELLTGVGKIVGLETLNLDHDDKAAIRWAMETGSESLANVEGNGDSAYMLGQKEGVGYITINHSGIGYRHRATVLCADTPERLASMYILAMSESYHVMKVGDEKRLQLEFGSNGFPEGPKSGLQWIADSSGSVSVSGQGEKATIVAKAVGEAAVKVVDPSGTALNSPFEIKISVRGNVGAYTFGGYEKIIGVVLGGPPARATVKMYDGTNEVMTAYSGLNYWIEDKVDGVYRDVEQNSNVITVNQVDNVFDITADAKGESKLKVLHKQYTSDPAAILVYTGTQDEIDAYYPIAADKTNYLLRVNETASIQLNTLADRDGVTDANGQTKLQNIQWGVENAGVLNLPPSNGSKQALVTALSPGTAVIFINYNGQTVERIYVTVTDNNEVDMGKFIVTESIIGIEAGEARATKVFTNLSASEANNLLWESSDTGIVTVSGTGDTAVITAQNVSGNANEAYVTVSYGSWLKRHILVYVCADGNVIPQYKAMNIDEQYIRMGRNEKLELPVFFAPVKSQAMTLWDDKYGNNVVKYTAKENGAKIEIESLNEGVAVLEAVNTGLSKQDAVLRIYIEVSNRYNNAVKEVRQGYLTALKTVWLLNPEVSDDEIELNVIGVGMTQEELAKVSWKIQDGGGQYVSVYPNGQSCTVRHNGREGSATVSASYVDNNVEFRVIVSSKALVGMPYIDGMDTIRVGKNGTVSAPYIVEETARYDAEMITFRKVQNPGIIDISYAGGVLEVKGISTGQALVKAGYIDNDLVPFEKDILVVVTTTEDGLIYLTTRDNFNVVKKGEYKTLNVEMIGFDNPAGTGYHWSVSPDDREFVSLDINTTGKQSQVKGEKPGTAKVIVRHDFFRIGTETDGTPVYDPMYDLVMYVRVVDEEAPTAYMTTQQNVISLQEGRTAVLEMSLVGGNAMQAEAFGFEAYEETDKNKFSVSGAGNRAVIQGIQAGTARLLVTNPYALNRTMTLFVIVEPVPQDNGIYFTLNEGSLIEIKPNEYRTVSATLVGGRPQDDQLFQWNIITENSIVKNPDNTGKTVVQLTPSGRVCVIRGVNEGDAIVEVSNPVNQNYRLAMRISVRETGEISFSQEHLDITQGQTMYIPVKAPSGTMVIYESAQPAIVWVSPSTGAGAQSSSSFCYIEARQVGTTKITARNETNTLSAEIIITVLENDVQNIGYIKTTDVIYNMTDWQSINNRLVLVGSPVGKKLNGKEFSDIDSADIYWEVDEKENDLIGFGMNTAIGADGRKTQEFGDRVSVYSLKPGIAKVLVSHRGFFRNGENFYRDTANPVNSDYYKTLYVNITPYNANFRLEPQFIAAKPQQVVSVEATIANIVHKDYSKVAWTLSDSQSAKFVWFEGEEIHDVTALPYTGESRVYVQVTGEESFQIRAMYDNQTTLESVVFVEREKSLELVMKDSFIQLLPNEDAYIGYKVSPVEKEASYFLDSTRFQEPVANEPVDYYRGNPEYDGTGSGEYKPIDWELFTEEPTHIFHVKATEIDGFNKVELRSHGGTLTKVLTLETNHNYMFKLDGATAVRGEPGETKTISYIVHPENDRVTYDSCMNLKDGTLPLSPHLNSELIKVDYLNHTITFTLERAGYGEYVFDSDYNKESGIQLVVPVYSYYNRIPLQWRLKNGTGGNTITLDRAHRLDVGRNQNRSWMDDEMNAIYIANGETGYISFESPSDNINYPTDGIIYPKKGDDGDYYNDRINMKLKGGDKIYINDNKIEVSNLGSGNLLQVRLEGKSGNDMFPFDEYGRNKNSLVSVKYMGELEITYEYYTGNDRPSEFTKTFLLYHEVWSLE